MTDHWEEARKRLENGTSSHPPELGFYWNAEEKKAHEERNSKDIENLARIEEAKRDTARIKAGVQLPQGVAPEEAITLEFAMQSDTATIKLEYLDDPFLPRKCVVGFFGRGSTAKSSFLATLAAKISSEYSTLWISVEEPTDWIKVRHSKCGGEDATLAVLAAVESKRDSHGRVIGSNFDVYEHLRPAILKAQKGFEQRQQAPRPLRLVTLDTAVGLTGWRKGETPNDDASVKRLLAYLQSLAEEYDLTIAIIGHSNKGKHEHFADTVAGATAWTNSPRLSFVHARDRQEEYGYVMRVAKTNFDTFGVRYSTEQIHTLYVREDGPDTVLAQARLGPIVWGENKSMELFEESTRKPRDEDGNEWSGKKLTLVQAVIEAIVEAVHETDSHMTRELIESRLGKTVSRREWGKVDERLRHAQFQYKVQIERGEQNKVLYSRLN